MKQTWTTPGGSVYKLFEYALAQPHLLIAGEPGSGKSVFADGLIHSIMHRLPIDKISGAKMILIDPKGTEFMRYEYLPHTIRYEYREDHYTEALEYAVSVMEQRFNENRQKRVRMYDGADLYLFIDEWADIKNVCGKQAVTLLQRLCQKGRAARVHVVLITQHPSAKVLPEEVRGCFDARIALRTASWKNSRIILDMDGAERLEIGTCLYKRPMADTSCVIVPWVKDAELDQLVSYWSAQKRPVRRGLFARV